MGLVRKMGGAGGDGTAAAPDGQAGEGVRARNVAAADAAFATTENGRAIRDQQALGGAGGASAGGVAGRGGDAASTLEVDDLAAASRSRHLDPFLLALAGNGGDATAGGTAGDGGDASASLSQRALEQTFLVQAGGGNGGKGDTGGGRLARRCGRQGDRRQRR